jgi:hypothetical protein
MQHRFKKHRDSWAKPWTNGVAAQPCYQGTHLDRQANCDLPGDVFGRHLQELRCLCPFARCRDRLPPTAPGAKSRPPLRRATFPLATAGCSATIARWRTLSRLKREQPDACTLQISRSGGSKCQKRPESNQPPHPAWVRAPRGFCVLSDTGSPRLSPLAAGKAGQSSRIRPGGDYLSAQAEEKSHGSALHRRRAGVSR